MGKLPLIHQWGHMPRCMPPPASSAYSVTEIKRIVWQAQLLNEIRDVQCTCTLIIQVYHSAVATDRSKDSGNSRFETTIDWAWFNVCINTIGYTADAFETAKCAVQKMNSFYGAMHFSAKRFTAIASSHVVCLSVRPSVCNVGELWSHRLEFFENNSTSS